MADKKPSIICRGKNLHLSTVKQFLYALPKADMPKDEFYNYAEERMNGFKTTHSQIARQMGLYYCDDNNICHPRFKKALSNIEILRYTQFWAEHYFVPNPYTPSFPEECEPTIIYSYLYLHRMESRSLDEELDDMFHIGLNEHDKAKSYLLQFTDMIELPGNKYTFANEDGANIPLHVEIDKDSEEAFFHYFSSFDHSTANMLTPEDLQKKRAENSKFLDVLHTKPFLLLAGISGTGKSRKVQELAYATCPRDGELDSDPTSPGNYCLIEVKPNWHDSTELLGYYSNLSGKYILTDFIRFVFKAIQHPDVPFFVCLDEMNLAPVEQYFAEYLSVLETRKRIQNEQTGEYEIVSAELITKKSFQNVKLKSEVATPLERGDDVPQEYKDLYTGEDLQVVKYIKENGLRLPQNLFVIGTVNMDDTTHQFSRKVIDRAFTIEMNGGDLSCMFDAKDTLSYAEAPLDAKYVVPSFAKAQEVLETFPNDADNIKEKVPKLLDEVNGDGIFKDTPFRVSYRVENEMVLYFGSLRQIDKESSAETLINKAFLAILLEKILPRVEGDEKAMHCGTDGSSAILKSLQNLVDGFRPEDYKQGDGSLYDIISRKLHEMNERVKTSYFTSFFS